MSIDYRSQAIESKSQAIESIDVYSIVYTHLRSLVVHVWIIDHIQTL